MTLIDRPYMTSYSCSILILVLASTVSETQLQKSMNVYVKTLMLAGQVSGF